ncbi:MAG: hypothetical protein ACI4KF_05145 [Huintestinicola sp.]
MKKMVTIILIVSIAAVLTTTVILVCNEQKVKEHSPLKSYSYNSSGGMTGGHDSIQIRQEDDERAIIITSSAEWHNSDAVIGEYYVPISVLNAVESIFDKHKMYRYNDLPDSKIFAYDAPTSSYQFKYTDGNAVYFSSSDMIPDKGYKGLRKIDELLSDAIAHGEKLPALVTENQTDSESFRELITGKCTLRVYEYSNNYLCYRIANGLEDELELSGDIVLYRIDGDDRQEIYRDDSGYEINAYALQCYDDFIKPTDRLTEGKYILNVSGYEAEFDIVK